MGDSSISQKLGQIPPATPLDPDNVAATSCNVGNAWCSIGTRLGKVLSRAVPKYQGQLELPRSHLYLLSAQRRWNKHWQTAFRHFGDLKRSILVGWQCKFVGCNIPTSAPWFVEHFIFFVESPFSLVKIQLSWPVESWIPPILWVISVISCYIMLYHVISCYIMLYLYSAYHFFMVKSLNHPFLMVNRLVNPPHGHRPENLPSLSRGARPPRWQHRGPAAEPVGCARGWMVGAPDWSQV